MRLVFLAIGNSMNTPTRYVTPMVAALAILAGCGDSQQGAAKKIADVPLAIVAPHAEIAWYDGTIEQAFAEAAARRKPLLIYWGAEWCPYCQALKKTVFTRMDFIEKTKLFIPVYLDGDRPGAQTWGARLKITGYPTMLVLRSDRTEVARLSGGMDVTLYATLIADALHDETSILAVLEGKHNAEDCHRLAYYGWDPEAVEGMDGAKLARALSNSASRCSGADQSRLEMLALNLLLQSKADPASLKTPVRQLFERLAEPETIRASADLLTALDSDLFDAVTAQGADFAAQFRTRYVERMQEASNNSRIAEADRLLALASALDAIRALSPDHAIPTSMQASARSRVLSALGSGQETYARGDLVNAAGIIYSVLGDEETAYQLYLRELPNTKTPYYYMSHLGSIEEKRGHREKALDWFANAHGASQGPATRVRWGSSYVRALIRLAPDDFTRIRAAALQVAAELRAGEAQGRSRAAITRIHVALDQWATTAARKAVREEILARLPRAAPSIAQE